MCMPKLEVIMGGDYSRVIPSKSIIFQGYSPHEDKIVTKNLLLFRFKTQLKGI